MGGKATAEVEVEVVSAYNNKLQIPTCDQHFQVTVCECVRVVDPGPPCPTRPTRLARPDTSDADASGYLSILCVTHHPRCQTLVSRNSFHWYCSLDGNYVLVELYKPARSIVSGRLRVSPGYECHQFYVLCLSSQ